jgi:ABC-type sugar transport system ATPase subunit
MVLLEIAAVTKVYGPLRALDGVDLVVEAGTFHGLIGPNGSGKSTLLKSIAGAHFPTTGKILFPMGWTSRCRPISARATALASNSRSPRC